MKKKLNKKQIEHLKKIGFKKGGDPRRSNGRPFFKGHKINVGKKRSFTQKHRENISNSAKGRNNKEGKVPLVVVHETNKDPKSDLVILKMEDFLVLDKLSQK